ncbi:MAG TPA: hypothetical protein VNG12_14320 [Acidimicrobiales bacterium]|nr:hypothetical protein [Acidimicrobiales bacterium]
MTKLLVAVSFIGALAVGAHDHALVSDLHSVQTRYASVTGELATVRNDVVQTASNAGSGVGDVAQIPYSLSNATHAVNVAAGQR